ncbi:hypothetical protein MKEN_00379100 [Mycena kentingensis (nom. inval.)]|nr:hypothetical protein MKEN_00379100 [Mycena kentingensis (nom. inval.)]
MFCARAALKRALSRAYSSCSTPRKGDRVVVGMSGGIDSSVTAKLLAAQDYDLSAVFMRNWDTQDEYGNSDAGCEWKRDWEDVQRVCKAYGIPCEMIDLSKEYWTRVFEPALQDWEYGVTPNPDVWCNREIKFGALLSHLPTGKDGKPPWLATGHYARKDWHNGRPRLLRSSDPKKDQTYYLSSIPEAGLAQAIFPLGDLTKNQVREIAEDRQMPRSVLERSESMGLCFIGEKKRTDFQKFISSYFRPFPGPIVLFSTGQTLGRHKGLWTFTIGQNVRLAGQPERLFVICKDIENNTIVVGPAHEPALNIYAVVVNAFSWIWRDAPPSGLASGVRLFAQIRHMMSGVPCTASATRDDPNLIRITFDEPLRGVAPGQVAALWDGDWYRLGAKPTTPMNIWRAIRRLLPSQGHKDEYELLPETSNGHHDPHSRPRRKRTYASYLRWFTLRRLAVLVAAVPFLVLFGILLSGVPPTYSDIRAFERGFPQHNTSIPASVDPPSYLRFPGHLWGHGLNNVLQEAIVMGYVAHRANRVYVFEDYTWSHLPFPYTIYDFALRATRIPLNAFIVGPLAGGPLPAPDDRAVQKRAISAAFYEQVCPRSAVHTVSATGAPTEAEGSALVDWWVKKLSDVSGARCVEVDSSEQPVFDRFLFGSPRVLSLLPGLNASPILGAFAWSPLVHSAVARNFPVLRPTNPAALYPPVRNLALSEDADTAHVLAGLVAVHLRRGDYKRHCPRLAQWGAGYMGVNTHPALPDRFEIPSSGPANASTPALTPKEIEAHYLEHCLPDPQQLARRLHGVRADHARRHPGSEPLARVYILTNAWGWFVNSVRSELVADGWSEVWASGDITLDAAQAGVGMAVDMRIAESADVFLGNGFSSLTSNIVMLRMARGLEPESNRFL